VPHLLVGCLIWIASHGRYCLIAGLLVGLFMPALSQALRPWVGPLIALLLCVTGIRVGARQALGHLDDLRPALIRIGLLQTGLPLVVVGVLGAFGALHWPIALAVCLMLAAPSLTGAPNFAIMMGQDPAPGMRLLVLGTALFPLTALPVLLILDPAGGGALSALGLSLGLLVAILCAVGVGFGVRRTFLALSAPRPQGALDGCAALLLAIVVVGLMSAIGPLLRTDPLALVGWLLAALAINIVLVVVTVRLSQARNWDIPVPTAIYAGNRNIALFLIVLPDEVAAPLMIFVGCYQIPMYLTPVLLSRLQRRTASA